MTLTAMKLWRNSLNCMRRCKRPIFLTHLLYSVLGVILFGPLVGVLGQFLLHFSGQPVLADQDIAWFLISPFGMASLILISAILIAILALEQASLMIISAATRHGRQVSALKALTVTAGQARRILSLALRLVARILLLTLPFLAVAALIAWFLISDYDINYYLAEKPPVFIATAAIIAAVLLLMLVLLVRKLLDWSLVLPLVLFTDTPPARAFNNSEQITFGKKHRMLAVLLIWAATAFILGILVLGSVRILGGWIIPGFSDSISWLVVILSGLAVLWILGNFIITTFTSASFAFLVESLYEQYGPGISTADVDKLELDKQSRRWHLTAPGLALLMTVALGAAVLTGNRLINGIQMQDSLIVVAHRGAAGKAPENTLASINQAIDDGTDWVEIDVQETADGKVVVIHDSDLMKLAGVDLKIRDGTLQQLQAIDVGSWFSPEFSGQRIPTLVEVLEAARGRSRVVIELKYYGHDQQLEQRVVDIVEQTGMSDSVAIMSLKYEGIQKIRELRPDWTIGLLSAKAVGNLSSLDTDFLAVNAGMAKPGFIRHTHRAGKQVFVWTINNPVDMSRMITLGVDGIITDEPAIAREVLAERANLSSVERLLIHAAVLFGRPPPSRLYRDESP